MSATTHHKIPLFLIGCFCFFIFLITGCQKAPMNGRLDGMWEVKEVWVDNEVEVPNQRIFYNFYMHVCSLTVFGGPYMDGNMIYDGDEITLDFPYAPNGTVTEKMKRYGIYSNPVTFTLEFHGSESLTLRDGDITVILKKF